MRSTVVIGIGNPVIADDASGLEVARHVQQHMDTNLRAAVTETYNGGLELMEAMVGFDRAFLIDAIVTGSEAGTIHRLGIGDITQCRNTSTTHNGSLGLALELGRLGGLKLPDEIRVWAIEAENLTTFCEDLTPRVRAAVPIVAAEILQQLAQSQFESRRLAI